MLIRNGNQKNLLSGKIRILSFWSKLLFGKESKLSLIIYRLCFEMYIPGTLNDVNFAWLKMSIKNIINECDVAYF